MNRIAPILIFLCSIVSAQCYIEKPLTSKDFSEFEKYLIENGMSEKELETEIHLINGYSFDGTNYKSIDVFTKPKKSGDRICYIKQVHFYKNGDAQWKSDGSTGIGQKVMVVNKDHSCPSTLDVDRFIHVGNISDFEIVRIVDNLPYILQKALSLPKNKNYGIELLNNGGYELKSISTTERGEGKPAGYELKFGKGVNCESMPTIYIYENESGFKVVGVGLLMV